MNYLISISTDMNTPEIRFKGFTEEWKKNVIGNLTSSYSGGTPSVSNHEYYGGAIPFIRSGEVHQDKTELFITEKGLSESSAKMVSKGQILYALYGATSGEVDICKINGAINQAILAIDSNDGIMNSFLCPLLQEKKSHIINTLIQGGQGNLSGTLVKGYNIAFPSITEQEKIASFFKSLDSMIDATAKKVASLKQTKQGCLQSMFPQEGETTPKVRFKGFTDEWVPTLIGDCGTWSKGRLLSKEDITPMGKNKCIHYGELFTLYGEVINEVKSKTDFQQGCLSEIGDILFPDSDVTPTGLARCSAILEEGVILGGGINILKPQKYIHSPFLSYAINKEKEQIISLVTGTTVRHINSKALSKVRIMLTQDIKEQHVIADFFSNLNKQIEMQEQKLEKLKQIKSACLNKMFI